MVEKQQMRVQLSSLLFCEGFYVIRTSTSTAAVTFETQLHPTDSFVVLIFPDIYTETGVDDKIQSFSVIFSIIRDQTILDKYTVPTMVKNHPVFSSEGNTRTKKVAHQFYVL
jgi:hypothetical protein